MVDPDDATGVADQPPPRERQTGLDGDTGVDTSGQDRVTVLVLVAASNHSRQGIDTTRAATPCSASTPAAVTASCTSDPVPIRITSGSSRHGRVALQHVATACGSGSSQLGSAVEHRQVLTTEREGDRPVWRVQSRCPGSHRLVRVGRTDHRQRGNGAKGGEMLDRLVRGAVLADADRVVGPDVDRRQPHQGRHAYCWPHVVAEHQEGADVGPGVSLQERCRWRSRPWRARARRSAGCGRTGAPATRRSGDRRAVRTAAPASWCCSTRRGRQIRPRARAGRRPAMPAPCPRPIAWRARCRPRRSAGATRQSSGS